MENRGKIALWVPIALVVCALATGILGTGLSLLNNSTTITTAGSVKGVGVGIYWNSACTNQTSSINWGLLEPGSSKVVTVYVRNEGNAAATLSKSAQNWNPSTTSSYMSLNWNYAGQILGVNQVLQVNLTLVVSSTVTGITNFSFDITISVAG